MRAIQKSYFENLSRWDLPKFRYMSKKTDNRLKSKASINNNLRGFEWLNNSIPVLIGIYLFFNPFPHTTAIKEICFYLSVVIVLVLILYRKVKFLFNTPLLIPIGLFVCWAFIGLFFALDKENSLHDYYSHLIRYIILYHILTNFFNSKKRLICLSWIIIISSCIFILGGIIYTYLITGNNLSLRFGITSIFAQSSFNIIGVTSVFAFILSSNQLYDQKNLYLKIFLGFSLMTLLIGLVLSQMRSSIIALFLSVFVLFYKNKKWMLVLFSLTLIVISIFNIRNRFYFKELANNLSNNSRIGIWMTTIDAIKDHPITGIGFGMQTYAQLDLKKYYDRLHKKYKHPISIDPHNMVLDIAVRLGVIGLLLFFYIIFALFKMLRHIIKYGKDNFIKDWGRCFAAAFIGVSVIGLLQPIFSHMSEVVLCTIFSMTTIVWRLNKDILQNDQKEDS